MDVSRDETRDLCSLRDYSTSLIKGQIICVTVRAVVTPQYTHASQKGVNGWWSDS